MIAKKFGILLLLIGVACSVLCAESHPLPRTLEYVLDIRIDYDHKQLSGRCELTILNDTDRVLERVPVLLYRLLAVTHVEDAREDSLPFHQSVVSLAGWEEIQVNFVEIVLVERLSPGEKTKMVVEYEGYLFGYAAEGWRYVKDHIARDFTLIRTDGFGYPVICNPSEKEMMRIAQEQFDYILNVTVPDGMRVVSAAKLIEKHQTDGQTTFRFRSKKPSWRIDIAISDYCVFENGQNKVFYFAADSLGARKVMSALQASFEIYTRWFGPLDGYQGFSIIEVPAGYSSQKDITAIILSAENFDESREMLTVYHEISHSWNVTNLDVQPCRFETEGFAQFMQFLMAEKLDHRANAVLEAAQCNLERVRNDFTEQPDYQNIAMKDYGVYDMVGYSYRLGMVVFALFYDLVGAQQFREIIGSFYAANYATGATLDEFIHHCKGITALDLERFFDDWIYTTRGVKLVMDGHNYEELLRHYQEH